MASSIRKAQSPLCCQLCDNPNVIKWKCKDCVLLMCDNCKSCIHPRFKMAETHTIISIKDVGKKQGDISAQFGSLKLSKPVISSVVSTYKSDFPAFGQIKYSGTDTVYCTYHLNEENGGFIHQFFIFRLLKESIKVLKNLDVKCTDFALDSNDGIYFAESHGSDLKLVTADGVTKTVLTTSPMVILCLHVNQNNEIILGLREQGSPFPVTEFSTRQIVFFDENRKRKLTIEYDQKGRKLFNYIWRIFSDSFDSIYAIDQFENEEGRLIALDRSGGVKFIYEGHSSVNTSQTPFNPMGIVITKTQFIIISDKSNHALHALNTQGELIGLQNVEHIGIELPQSLCLDGEDFLLIGCNTLRGRYDAKIHVAKITL
ncbi:uncharacterized protein [Mytilus edulis]|uniref:uncharacterized protein isoform X1 n=1 Tax=Mytilus edulis TaxID=6550 RepID=UPI0039F086F8